MRLRRTAGTAAPDPSAPTLIGVDDLKVPSWAQVDETMASSGTSQMLRAQDELHAAVSVWSWSPSTTRISWSSRGGPRRAGSRV